MNAREVCVHNHPYATCSFCAQEQANRNIRAWVDSQALQNFQGPFTAEDRVFLASCRISGGSK